MTDKKPYANSRTTRVVNNSRMSAESDGETGEENSFTAKTPDISNGCFRCTANGCFIQEKATHKGRTPKPGGLPPVG
jgi:hypothetical protein